MYQSFHTKLLSHKNAPVKHDPVLIVTVGVRIDHTGLIWLVKLWPLWKDVKAEQQAWEVLTLKKNSSEKVSGLMSLLNMNHSSVVCATGQKLHVSAYALIALLCFHSYNTVLSFAIGREGGILY